MIFTKLVFVAFVLFPACLASALPRDGAQHIRIDLEISPLIEDSELRVQPFEEGVNTCTPKDYACQIGESSTVLP